MSDIIFDIKIDELIDSVDHMTQAMQDKVNKAISLLTAQAHAKMVEEAQDKLKSRRQTYLDNLSAPEREDNTHWVITLYEPAVWIEDGQKSGSMIEAFLKSPKTKTGKNGKYLVIPFKHNKPATNRTQGDKMMVETLKREMKKREIPFRNIERDAKGSPKLGLLHSFNMGGPNRQHQTGMGELGPMGKPFMAHSRGSGRAGPNGRPFMWGMRVYQRETDGPKGKGVKKEIMTFRTVSQSQIGTGKWQRPEQKGAHIFESVYNWIEEEFERMKPEIINSILE